MEMAFQIGIGLWLGGVLLIASVATVLHLRDHIERNRRYGRPWYRLS